MNVGQSWKLVQVIDGDITTERATLNAMAAYKDGVNAGAAQAVLALDMAQLFLDIAGNLSDSTVFYVRPVFATFPRSFCR